MKTLFRPICVALALLALAYTVRYKIIEPETVRALCEANPGAWQCQLKMGLVHLFQFNRLGWAALILGVAAFASSQRSLAWAGWVCGLLATVFYCYDMGAAGALLSLIALSRQPKMMQTGYGESNAHA